MGGGGFNLFTLKVTALVNLSSLSLIGCYMIIINIVNMFLVIKHGRFDNLGESVMCGTDGLLSL